MSTLQQKRQNDKATQPLVIEHDGAWAVSTGSGLVTGLTNAGAWRYLDRHQTWQKARKERY